MLYQQAGTLCKIIWLKLAMEKYTPANFLFGLP